MPTRRQFVAAALTGVASVPVLTVLYAWWIEPHWLEVTHHDLPVAFLPGELAGKTLVQLSDLHIGPKVDDQYVIRTFQRVAALQPDFVAVTGDWITYRGPAQFDQLQRLLGHLPRGRLGTVGILGNHDYGFGWRMSNVADRVSAIVRAAGVALLRNEAVRLSGLQFVGLDDLWGPRFDPRPVLTAHGADGATLVLSHNPDSADREVWGIYGGWILAGHTHGGQCKPPFLPPPLLPVQNKRYTSGVFGLSDGRTLYISRGVGHFLPVRFNVRPEVTVFRLQPAPLAASL